MASFSDGEQRKRRANERDTNDEIYGFLFDLPCLLQRLVDNTILFSLFLHRWRLQHCRDSSVLGRLLHIANSPESLDWGAFILRRPAERVPVGCGTRTHLIMPSTNYEAAEHFHPIASRISGLGHSITASGN